MNTTEKAQWLESLQAGDTVAITGNSAFTDSALAKIERVTKSQIIANGRRFWRKDGYSVGSRDSYNYLAINEATPEIMEQIERRRLLNYIQRNVRNWADSATLDQLRRIMEIIKEQ